MYNNMERYWLCYLSTVALVLLAGCGTFGGTSMFTLRDGIPSTTDVRISLGSLEREEGDSKTEPVFVFGFSGFDEDDQKHLASSLESTLASMTPMGTTIERQINVHVLVRRYMVVASDNAIGVIACVSWALVEERRVVFAEQFYAAGSGFFVRTVGGVKDDVNKAIVRRIALKTLWATHPDSSRSEAPITPKTFNDFGSAARKVPRLFISFPPIPLIVPHAPQWSWAEVTQSIDWNKRLAQRGIVDVP